MDHDHDTAREEEAAAAVWRGTVRAVASGPTPDEAWALLGDFCSLDRWVSTVRTCRRVVEVEVDGAAAELPEPEPDGRPTASGCVRYCEGPVNMAAPGEPVGWSKERLLEADHAGRWYSYELLDSNKGFGRYRATVRVEHDPAGCAVTWSFEADPVKGWTLEGFVAFLDKLARGVAQRLEEEIMVKPVGEALKLQFQTETNTEENWVSDGRSNASVRSPARWTPRGTSFHLMARTLGRKLDERRLRIGTQLGSFPSSESHLETGILDAATRRQHLRRRKDAPGYGAARRGDLPELGGARATAFGRAR